MGVSRQRIEQIVSPPQHIYEAVKERANSQCEDCGIIIKIGAHLHHNNGDDITGDSFNDLSNIAYLCPGCHRRRHRISPTTTTCQQCQTVFDVGRRVTKFCSDRCARAYYRVSVVCDQCGEAFTLVKSQAQARIQRNNLHFCSRHCHGIWFGKHHKPFRGHYVLLQIEPAAQQGNHCICQRCGHHWNTRVKVPVACPNRKCQSYHWNKVNNQKQKRTVRSESQNSGTQSSHS